MLTKRQTAIFKTIVDEFTRTAEPVGSKKLMDLLDFNCSSATIRNEMAALEDLGLLEKTHTSSGRIPSSRGYRFYVENLMERELDDGVKHSLQAVFQERHYSMDEIVKKSCDILSQMTSLTSVVLGPESRYQTLQHIQLFPLSDTSAVAVFITDHGHTENKTFHFNTAVSVEDIKTCCNLLNAAHRSMRWWSACSRLSRCWPAILPVTRCCLKPSLMHSCGLQPTMYTAADRAICCISRNSQISKS